MLEILFEQFAKQVCYGTDTGISIEIKDFFRGRDDVVEYKIEILDDKKYKVSVKLKTYSLQEVKKVFSAFLHFIELFRCQLLC